MKERGASFKLFTSIELVVSFRQEKGREMIGESAQGLMLMCSAMVHAWLASGKPHVASLVETSRNTHIAAARHVASTAQQKKRKKRPGDIHDQQGKSKGKKRGQARKRRNFVSQQTGSFLLLQNIFILACLLSPNYAYSVDVCGNNMTEHPVPKLGFHGL